MGQAPACQRRADPRAGRGWISAAGRRPACQRERVGARRPWVGAHGPVRGQRTARDSGRAGGRPGAVRGWSCPGVTCLTPVLGWPAAGPAPMRCQTFVASARDSGHKYAPHGVGLLSAATTGRVAAAEHSMRMFDDRPAPACLPAAGKLPADGLAGPLLRHWHGSGPGPGPGPMVLGRPGPSDGSPAERGPRVGGRRPAPRAAVTVGLPGRRDFGS